MTEKHIASFGLSLALTNLFSAALVILKESNEGVMAWMKAATGHHWVTHGVVILLLFVVLGIVIPLARSNRRAGELNGVAVSVAVSVIVSGLMIAGFFLMAS